MVVGDYVAVFPDYNSGTAALYLTGVRNALVTEEESEKRAGIAHDLLCCTDFHIDHSIHAGLGGEGEIRPFVVAQVHCPELGVGLNDS